MSFEKIKKNLGFGCMRMKMTEGGEVDYDEFKRMIDSFIAAGFNYFDTAHGYIDGKSEIALRDCLTSRYNREDFVLANKLSAWYFEKNEDIRPLFESQLERCGVEYFDFYLFHTLTREIYQKHKDCDTFTVIKELRDEGKIKHIAMSFHDTADVLDTILTEQPYIEAVQLQINYLDYDDPTVQSKACYDVAVKHGKRVIVMEPVKGGHLANPPERAAKLFDELGKDSYASYALRFAASFPEVFMVLSGMATDDIVKENIKTFADFKPLNEAELRATEKARAIIREVRQIPCTACSYCTEVCPKHIPVPELFKTYNKLLGAKISRAEAKDSFPKDKPAAAECIKCGKCEGVCPQGIEIRKQLEKIAKIG